MNHHRREHQRETRIAADQQHQRHRHDQFVCDRIQEGAERSGLAQAPRQISIQSIRDGRRGEHQARRRIAQSGRIVAAAMNSSMTSGIAPIRSQVKAFGRFPAHHAPGCR